MAYLGRAHLRQQVAQAESVRIASAGKEDFVTWSDDLRRRTEVPRG